MSNQEICKKLIEIISSAIRDRVEMDSIDKDTDLINEKGMNSLEALEVLVRAENEFGIQIEDEDLSAELVRTISSLSNYIEEKLKSA